MAEFNVQSYPAGSVIFAEREPGKLAYLIRQGTVEIVSGDGDAQVVLAKLGPGEVFGEMSLVTNAPRTATAVAREFVEVVILPPAAVEEQMQRLTPLMRELLLAMARRLGATSGQLKGKTGPLSAPPSRPAFQDALLSLDDLSDQFGFGFRELRRYINTGELPPELLRFPKVDMVRWVAQMREAYGDLAPPVLPDDGDEG